MKKTFYIFLFLLMFSSAYSLFAQQITPARLSATEPTLVTYNSSTDLPGWVRDLRRFDIIMFGIFPFSMFAVTTVTDLIRWWDANQWDVSDEGRRYAPWPAKSAGAVEMTNDEIYRTVLIAAGVSVAVAFIDYLIVKNRRDNERRKAESLPSGSYEIEHSPYGEPEEETGGEE